MAAAELEDNLRRRFIGESRENVYKFTFFMKLDDCRFVFLS